MSAYNGSDKYIFVSYSHKNKDIALPFIEELQKHYYVWYDEGLSFGKAYDEEITEKIANCSLFIFLVTKESIISEYCLNEIRFATDKKQKAFIIVYLEETEVPDSFEFKYGRYQYCNCYAYGTCADAIFDMESKSDQLRLIKINSFQNKETKNLDGVVQTKRNVGNTPNEEAALQAIERINDLFGRLRVDAHIAGYAIGPTVTRLDVEYGNSSSSVISKMLYDIEIILGGKSVTFMPVVPGKTTSGLYFANEETSRVDLFKAIDELNKNTNDKLAIPLGRDENNNLCYASLAQMRNILIGGSSGSGKSTFLHSAIISLASRNGPEDLKLILIDDSNCEFNCYSKLPQLTMHVFTNHKEVYSIISGLINIINTRFEYFSGAKVKDIDSYNLLAVERNVPKLAKVVVFIDRYDDLVDKNNDIAKALNTVLLKSRAAGIYFVITIQRFNFEAVSNQLKANIPTRISFITSNSESSVLVIGEAGAEKLITAGDMLVKSPCINHSYSTRLQSCYVSEEDRETAVKNIIKEYGEFGRLTITTNKK